MQELGGNLNNQTHNNNNDSINSQNNQNYGNSESLNNLQGQNQYYQQSQSHPQISRTNANGFITFIHFYHSITTKSYFTTKTLF